MISNKSIILFGVLLSTIFRLLALDSWESWYSFDLGGYRLLYVEIISVFLVFFLIKKRQDWISIFFILFFLLSNVVSTLLFQREFALLRILGSSDLAFIALLFVLWNPNKIDFLQVRYVLLLVFLMLAVEIALFSTIIDGRNVHNVSQNYEGIYRINTTMGGSTGSAATMFLISAWLCNLFVEKRIRTLILLIANVVIFMTLSRGSILAILLLDLFFILKGFKNLNLRRWTIILLALGLLTWSLPKNRYYQSLSDALTTRVTDRVDAGDITTGRSERFKYVFDSMRDNILFGRGGSSLHPYERIRNSRIDYSESIGSVHNFYLAVLYDYGAIGLFSIMIVLVRRLYVTRKSLSSVAKVSVFITFLVTFNTEVILLDAQYAVIFFGVISSYDK